MIELSPFPTGYVTVELYYSGSWHDITADLSDDGVKITRRAGQPSSCELTLKSDAGKYSPRNPASPLFGLIGRNTPIRVRTQPVSGGTVHTRFVGEVASWPARWTNRGTSYAPIECAGVLRRLGQGAAPLRSPLYRAISSIGDPLVGYWPMEDSTGSAHFASGLDGGRAATWAGTPTLASDDGWPGSAALPVLGSSSVTAVPSSHASTGETQVSALFYVPAGTATRWLMEIRYKGGTVRMSRLRFVSGGALYWAMYDDDGAVIADSTIAFTLDGKRFWVSFEVSNSGSNIARSVATWVVGDPSGLVSSATVATQSVGKVSSVVLNPGRADLGDLSAGHLTVETDVAGLSVRAGSLNGWSPEDAADRIDRLCDENSVGIAVAGTSPVAEKMGPQGMDTLLSLLDEAVETGQGILCDRRDDVGLAYRTIEDLYNQTPVLEVAYTDNLLRPFEPTEDDQGTRNRVTVTRDGGTSATVQRDDGALAVAEIGLYDEAVTLSLADDDQPAEHAAWRVALGTHDEPRWPNIGIDLADSHWLNDSALTEDVLAVDIGDRIDVSNLPAWLPPDDVRGLVTGYDEEIGPMHYRVTFTCLPERPYEVGVWDGTGSRYSGAGTVLAEALDATETGVDVTPPDGVTWTHADGDYDVMVGGERMTVTAVAGNTLTVTRSVNGVVKTHAAGALLDLAEPVRYAL